MRLLLDTNIICDFLGVNKGFSDAVEKIIQLSIDNEAIELVSASAMTDIYYVLRRETKDVKETVSQLQRLRSLIGILPVTESDIDIALSRGWKDFEDAVQYTVAESNHIDYIISRNTKDFEEDEIPCVDPVDFIENIYPKLK